MKTLTPKSITVTHEAIETLVRGCPWNNPITVALKEQGFPDANEIVVHGNDEIYVDGMAVFPTIAMIRFIKDWNSGKKVVPMCLGYHCE